MATIISSNPDMQDLKITIQESSLVFPLQQTERRSFFLSNIDQILNYRVPTAFFFSANPDYPPQLVSERLKLALQKVLVPYDFMAGRLMLNKETSRLEIDCNSAGAGFVVASSEFSLHEIGDLVSPNLGFQQLAVHTLGNLGPNDDDKPPFILQVTSFKCGGFAIGMSVNHILLDGLSAKAFNENLASQAFDGDKPLSTIPFFDRRLMSARSPPQVGFTHPEFFKPDFHTGADGPPVFDCKKEDLVFKVFKLTKTDINFLKEKAKSPQTRISSFIVAATLIWRCKALSSVSNQNKEEEEEERISTLLNVVDLRSRLSPPLPSSYCGNAILVAYTSEKPRNIETVPFSELVKMVADSPTRISDEYARSVIDWLEINRGLPCGDYMLSSWLRLGFEEVVFPWGKPQHSGPVVNHRKDICWMFPSCNNHGAINALVSLPAEEMEKFESHFCDFFTCNGSSSLSDLSHEPVTATTHKV